MTKTLDNVSNIMDLTNNKSKYKFKSKSKKKKIMLSKNNGKNTQ